MVQQIITREYRSFQSQCNCNAVRWTGIDLYNMIFPMDLKLSVIGILFYLSDPHLFQAPAKSYYYLLDEVVSKWA